MGTKREGMAEMKRELVRDREGQLEGGSENETCRILKIQKKKKK